MRTTGLLCLMAALAPWPVHSLRPGVTIRRMQDSGEAADVFGTDVVEAMSTVDRVREFAAYPFRRLLSGTATAAHARACAPPLLGPAAYLYRCGQIIIFFHGTISLPLCQASGNQ